MVNGSYKIPANVNFYGWSSSSNYSSINLTSKEYQNTTDMNFYIYAETTNNIGMDNNGLTVEIQDDFTLKTNYIYSSSIILCSTVQVSSFQTVMANVDMSQSATYNYNASTVNIGAWSGVQDTVYNYCYTLNSLFSPSGGGRSLRIKVKGTSSSGKYGFFGYSLEELGLFDQWLGNTITNAIATQNTTIQGYINTASQNIISQMAQNTQSTNQAIDDQTEQQHNDQLVCNNVEYILTKNNAEISGKYLDDNGAEIENANYYISNYLRIGEGQTRLLQNPLRIGTPAYCWYNNNKEKISCTRWNGNATITATAPTGTYYIRTSIHNDSTITIKGSYCDNGNQAISDGPGWTNEDPDDSAEESHEEAQDELNDYLTNDEDLENIDFEIDVASNTAIWGIFSNIITQNSVVYGSTLSILFLGIIKLIFAR